MKKLLTLVSVLMMLGLFVNVWSAITEYTFSQGTGTYTAATGTAILVGSDDGTSGPNNIGFTFTYDGTAYTQFYASANGHIRLGTSAPAAYYDAVSNTSNSSALVPLNRDGRSTGGIVTQTTGSAPNRVCVIDFPQWDLYYGSTSDRVNMQIILTETSNTVKFVYGASTRVSSYTAQLGLRGVSTAATDFVNRSTTTNWAATTAGASSSATMTWSTACYPADGQYYMWTPPVAGTVPNPANIASPANGATGVDVIATLNWSSGGGLPAGYRLSLGTDNPPTNILFNADQGVANTYDPNPNLIYSTIYYWQVIPYNAFGPAVGCPVWSFTAMPDPTITTFPYVQTFDVWPPAGWNLTGGTFQWAQYISTDNWAYANYWGMQAGNTAYMTLPPIHSVDPVSFSFTWSHQYMASYPTDALTVQTSTDGTNWTNVWTKAATEFNSNDGASTSTPGTGITETIPLGFADQSFYLRFYGYSGYGPDPFIDDVTFTSVPAGTPPDEVTLTTPANATTGLNPLAVTLQWTNPLTGGIAEYYSIFVGADPIDPGTDYYGEYYYETLAPANTFNLSAQTDIMLDWNSRWYWSVQANNTAGSSDIPVSNWFQIMPDPSILALPYTQNFDGAPAFPTAWVPIVNDGSFLQVNTNAPHSAPNNVQMYNVSTTSSVILASPPVGPAIPMNSFRVKFWALGSVGYNLLVGTVNTPLPGAVFTQVANVALTGTYAQYDVSFGAYAGTDRYIAFKHGGTISTYQYIYFDDVQVMALPTTPIFSLTPADGAFGSVLNSGGNITRTFTILNDGIGTLPITAISLSGASQFSLVGLPALPYDVNAGLTTTFGVEFNTSVPGTYAGMLHITDGLGRVMHDIPVSGMVTDASGGYYMADSFQTGAPSYPTYNWIDIEATGTAVTTLTDDNFAGPVTMGMSFPFFGTTYTDVYLSSNGHISFGVGSSNLGNVAIPTAGGTDNFIAFCWDDMYPPSSYVLDDWVKYATVDGKFVVTYYKLPEYGVSTSDYWVTAQVILYPNGKIKIQYAATGSLLQTDNTIGIEGPGGLMGLQYHFGDGTTNVGGTMLGPLGESKAIAFGTDILGLGDGIALAAPVVTVHETITGLHLEWDAVAGANSYKLYTAINPYGTWTLYPMVFGTTFVDIPWAMLPEYGFMQITASTDPVTAPAGRTISAPVMGNNIINIKKAAKK